MIERLRALSPPVRYAAYIIGVVILFFVAVVLGAAVGFVVSQQFGAAPIDSVETGAFDGGKLDRTGTMGVFEDAKSKSSSGSKAIEPSSEFDNSNDTAREVSFVHQATVENSRGDYTYISNPTIDDDAVVLASPTSDRGQEAALYEHNIGVWYEPVARR